MCTHTYLHTHTHVIYTHNCKYLPVAHGILLKEFHRLLLEFAVCGVELVNAHGQRNQQVLGGVFVMFEGYIYIYISYTSYMWSTPMSSKRSSTVFSFCLRAVVRAQHTHTHTHTHRHTHTDIHTHTHTQSLLSLGIPFHPPTHPPTHTHTVSGSPAVMACWHLVSHM